MSWPDRVDLTVVGAGSSGAALAALCAERGLTVALCEAREMEHAGARWLNVVPTWTFRRAGIEPPEQQGSPVGYLYAGWGGPRVKVTDHQALEVDMPRLVARLQRQALEAGAVLLPRARVLAVEGTDVRTSRGSFTTRWIADATGADGARLMGQPEVGPTDLCHAAQQVRQVSDEGLARRFLDEHHVEMGDVPAFLGIAGGFSTLTIRVEPHQVALLAGSIPALGHPPGHEMLRVFVNRQAWIGQLLWGGQGKIPLRRPYDRLCQGPLSIVGDAACQVFSPHGSGVGMGLVAARMLADALFDGSGPAGYAARFQRELGGPLAGFESFRRLSQTLSPSSIEELVASGLLCSDAARMGITQQLELPGLESLIRMALGVVRAPHLAASLARVLGQMALLRGHYATYPGDPSRVQSWSRRLRWLGMEPDP